MENNHITLSDILQPNKVGAFYGRFSTDKQDYLMQKSSIEGLLKDYSCKLYEIEFVDEDTSAVKIPMDKREKLNKLKKAAENKEFDFIIVYAFDRIARDVVEHQKFRKEMNSLNMPVVISQTREIYTSTDVIPVAVKDGMTKMEAVLIRERTADTLKSMKKNGKWTGGKAPYGYTYDSPTKSFSIVANQINRVREIFELFKSGLGLNEIVKKMKETSDGIEKWNKDKIKLMITNPFYAGFVTQGRLKNNVLTDRNQWTLARNTTVNPIMTLEEWEYVMQIYETRRELHNPKRYKTPFYLKNILHCQNCNKELKTRNSIKKVKGNPKYGKQYYYCESSICSIKEEVKVIHDYFEKKVLPTLLASKQLKANAEAKKGLIEKHIELDLIIADLIDRISKLNNKLSEIQQLQNEMELKDLEDTVDETLYLESLIFYRLHIQKEKTVYTQRIEELKLKISQIKKAIKHAEENNETLNLSENPGSVTFRRMLLELFPRMIMDSNGKIDIDVNFIMD